MCSRPALTCKTVISWSGLNRPESVPHLAYSRFASAPSVVGSCVHHIPAMGDSVQQRRDNSLICSHIANRFGTVWVLTIITTPTFQGT